MSPAMYCSGVSVVFLWKWIFDMASPSSLVGWRSQPSWPASPHRRSSSSPSRPDLDAAVDLLRGVDLQRLGGRAVDHGAGGDVEPRAVALAHDRGAGEQASGERACPLGAGAEVIE